MLLRKQLEFLFRSGREISLQGEGTFWKTGGPALRLPNSINRTTGTVAGQLRAGRDPALEMVARHILTAAGAARVATSLRVQWNPRLKTCAGRADSRNSLIVLNPRLREYGAGEIDRTLRHELAHLLAQFRVGRRRIRPHGPEWRQACRDLSIADESRCHNLPFAISARARRFLYQCPNCRRDFPRARRSRRALACLACCRAYNRGKFDARFRLKLASPGRDASPRRPIR